MTGIISVLQWIIANWSLLATLFSSGMSVALFFMHGSARSDIQELQQFISSLQVSQSSPIDTNSAKGQAVLKNPKI